MTTNVNINIMLLVSAICAAILLLASKQEEKVDTEIPFHYVFCSFLFLAAVNPMLPTIRVHVLEKYH